MSVTSFSRLGTANAYDSTVATLQARQNSLSNLQESLSSGKKINTPADDPTGAAQAERALNRLSRIATDQRALETQRNAIASAESTLGSISDALQQVRELTVSAGNGTFTASDRKTVADQIAGLRTRILSLANTQDSNGQPLFAALGSALNPFAGPATGASPDYTFNGLPGTASGDTYAIAGTLDGDSAFMLRPARDGVYNVKVGSGSLGTDAVNKVAAGLVNGSSYAIAVTAITGTSVSYNITATLPATVPPTSPLPAPTTIAGTSAWSAAGGFTITEMPGLSLHVNGTPAVGNSLTVDPNTSVFGTLDHAVADLTAATTSAAASQAVTQALNNIDISMARISAVRGQAGDLLNRADSITSANTTRNIEQEANKSRAEDVDMIKAVSDFQKQQTGYQAALQSYAQIQKLSLFNYIG